MLKSRDRDTGEHAQLKPGGRSGLGNRRGKTALFYAYPSAFEQVLGLRGWRGKGEERAPSPASAPEPSPKACSQVRSKKFFFFLHLKRD